jgi:hypothetical protein
MNDLDRHKEVCELLKKWFYLETKGIHWSDVKIALETRINLLLESEG